MKKIILITGLGGSGTRIFAEIIKNLDIHIGNNINRANDNKDLAVLLGVFNKNITNDPYNKNYYESFSNTVKLQFKKSGYNDRNIFCIKNPYNMHLLHYYIKFCELEKYELIVFYIIRDGRYMLNSTNKIQYRQFKNRYTYKNDNHYKYLEFWYHINKETIELLTNKNINKLVLSYDNMILDTKNTINKMCEKINIDYTIYQHKFEELIKKIKDFKPKSKKEIIPNKLINYIDRIFKFVEN